MFEKDFMLADGELTKESENTASLATEEEMIYYLITDTTEFTWEQMDYPIEVVFAVNFSKKPFTETLQMKHKTSSRFVIHGQTPNEINDQILKLLPPMPENSKKAFFIDHHLAFSPADRLTLYCLLLQSCRHVYFLGSTTKEQNDFSDFTEIFPDEKSVMLFEQTPEFAAPEDN
jgi:hypothetical protein